MEEEFDKIVSMVKYRVSKSVPEAEVEDVVQDVLERIWKGWESFDGNHLSGWVDKVTRNTVLNWLRDSEPQTDFLDDDKYYGGLSDENTPEMELIAEQEVYDKLNFKEEQCLRYYSKGLSCEDIATLMGSTEGSVQVTISHAKSKLHQGTR